MLAHFIYSGHYDISFWGLNRFHPFDGWKFSKAWNIINSEFRNKAISLLLNPAGPVSDELLLAVHNPAYLTSLQQSVTVSQVMEVKLIQYLPNHLLQKKLLNPLRIACTGTILAAETALHNKAIAMNFAGGYHHAYPDHGDGFCFFGDAALSIVNCRQKELLKPHEKILMIDLDAHRGNGFYAMMGHDPSVHIFDMYNFQTYPGYLDDTTNKHPYIIPLKAGTRDEQYMDILSTQLPIFLNEHKDAKLVFYNAGNDIYENDRLGKLSVSFSGVLRRDSLVLDELSKRLLPTVIMTSGGYTRTSHRFIAELAKSVIRNTN